MKIKAKTSTYDQIMAMEPFKNKRPEPQGAIWRKIIKLASAKDLKKVGFEVKRIGMEKLGDEPCLFLMNHSSFIDLEIAGTIIYPRPYHIVCTLDGFVGKEGLMRKIGCIPTRKFMMDTSLVRDLIYTAKELKESILLYPEASYTFDGTATPLPESLGKLAKMLDMLSLQLEKQRVDFNTLGSKQRQTDFTVSDLATMCGLDERRTSIGINSFMNDNRFKIIEGKIFIKDITEVYKASFYARKHILN